MVLLLEMLLLFNISEFLEILQRLVDLGWYCSLDKGFPKYVLFSTYTKPPKEKNLVISLKSHLNLKVNFQNLNFKI